MHHYNFKRLRNTSTSFQFFRKRREENNSNFWSYLNNESEIEKFVIKFETTRARLYRRKSRKRRAGGWGREVDQKKENSPKFFSLVYFEIRYSRFLFAGVLFIKTFPCKVFLNVLLKYDLITRFK